MTPERLANVALWSSIGAVAFAAVPLLLYPLAFVAAVLSIVTAILSLRSNGPRTKSIIALVLSALVLIVVGLVFFYLWTLALAWSAG